MEFMIRPARSFQARVAGEREAGAAGSEQSKIPELGDPRAGGTGGGESSIGCALRS
jgi:hypothetical protein